MAAPADNFDVQLLDQNGTDLLEGLGMNLDMAETADIPLIYSSTSLHPVVDESDTLTLRITGNFVSAAELRIDVYFALGK